MALQLPYFLLLSLDAMDGVYVKFLCMLKFTFIIFSYEK